MDTRLIAYDYETYWDSTGYTLSKLSPVAYITDRRFYPQLLGVCVNYGDVVVYEHDDIPHALKELELDRPGTMVVAHNGNGFDHLITAFKYGVHPWMMLDTITMMRWCGYSRVMRESHQALTDALGHGIKQAGTVVSDGKRTKKDFTASEWAFFKQYCADDTLQCAMNTLSMLPKVPMDALLFSHLTACMATKPAFVLDEKMLAEHLADLDAKLKQAHADIQSTFAFPDTESMLKAIRSKQRFSDMLRSYGVEPPMKLSVKQSLSCRRGLLNAADLAEKEGNTAEAESLRAKAQDESCYSVYEPALSKTDVDFLALTEHENPHVQALVNLRLQFNSSGHRSRVEKFLQLAKLHRPVSVMLKAYYAHTSRYGAGVSEGKSDQSNMQNLGKHNPAMLPLRHSIKAPRGCAVVACDSSQIEARILAYLARQDDLLDHFRQGRDPYAELGSKIFGVSAEEIHEGNIRGDKKMKQYRYISKKFILSCLAGSTLVLTDTGWKPMVMVSVTDKLWDGEQWVKHQGLIWNGKRRVQTLDGVTLTPNHLIWNGSSWSRAAELHLEPKFLSRARSIAAKSLMMCELCGTQGVNTASNIRCTASGAGLFSGIMSIPWLLQQKTIAVSVLSIIRNKLTAYARSSVNSLTQNRELSLENSQLFVHIQRFQKVEQKGSNVLLKLLALVGRQVMSCFSVICCQVRARDAMLVLNVRQQEPSRNFTGSMKTYAQILSTGGAYSIVSLIASNVVRTQTTLIGKTMGDVASLLTSQTEPVSSSTLCLFPGGMTRCWNWIESTMREGMHRAICGLYRKAKTCGIVGVTEICRRTVRHLSKRMMHFENVYDFLNSGPNHRFTILTNKGPLIVHNCGYGTGFQKAADVLWTEGARMADERRRHTDLVAEAHGIYRTANDKIVLFWKRCDQVLHHMALGGSGAFGGPNDDLFKYGKYPSDRDNSGLLSKHARIVLPNGYVLMYPNLRTELDELSHRYQMYYDQCKGSSIIKTKAFGAYITENCCQSLAFALLMWQACRMHEAGIQLHANIHDSFASVCPASKADTVASEMKRIMSLTPEWLPGFPVACEVEIGDDFSIV